MFFSFQVEALAVQLTQREGELIQEKTEVKKLADFLKKVTKFSIGTRLLPIYSDLLVIVLGDSTSNFYLLC